MDVGGRREGKMWGGWLWAQVWVVNWTVSHQDPTCTYYQGEVEQSGAIPVRVECEWAVDAAQAARVLSEQAGHDEIFRAVSESTVLSDDGRKRRVYQVQHAAGVTDRHVILEYTKEQLVNGWRFQWRKADDQSELRGDGVEVEVTEGEWVVTETETGMRLEYELRYLPGGKVPVFLVGWFQGMGTRQVIGDLRESLIPFNLP